MFLESNAGFQLQLTTISKDKNSYIQDDVKQLYVAFVTTQVKIYKINAVTMCEADKTYFRIEYN